MATRTPPEEIRFMIATANRQRKDFPDCNAEKEQCPVDDADGTWAASAVVQRATPELNGLRWLGARGVRLAASAIQAVERTSAVAEAFDRRAYPREHRNKEIVEGRARRQFHMATGSDRAASAAGQKNREVSMRVRVAVTQAAAVENHTVVEQRSAAFPDQAQLAQKRRILSDEIAVDVAKLSHKLFLAAVVRQG